MESAMELHILLLKISDSLSQKELEDMKFLCQGPIVRKKMESITSPIHLFRQLQELVLISEDDLSFLVKLLNNIKRYDLAQEVENFQGATAQGDAAARDHLDQAFDIICDNVGKEWKRLIRILGVSDVIMDRVIDANRYDMREQLMQCLREWKKMKKDGATISVLVKALEDCRMRLVSEKLSTAINLSHGTS
ncbi:FAS-associated death domain protein [Leptodactylus fuscus]|uniref:FAS-associated death domain protein n=1 Tax=Leptodactylus fuscus TaxID=238119 RepID=UPI003F4EC66D